MDHNPFADNSSYSDPFADPSVVSATQGGDRGGNSFNNPFEDADKGHVMPLPKRDTSASFPGQHDHEPSGGNLTVEDLRRREEQLRAKENELKARESHLSKRESSGGVARKNNWPSQCYPILYHSINDEIPNAHRNLVRKFYVTVLFTWLCLAWNTVTLLAAWGAPDTGGRYSSDSLWSSIYLVLGVPGAWRLWYRSIYYGIRDRTSTSWIFFFVAFFAHVVFSGCMAVAVPSFNGAGLLLMIQQLSWRKSIVSIMSAVAMIMWGLNTLLSFYLLKKAHTVWKGSGSADELKKDLISGATHAVAEQAAEDMWRKSGGKPPASDSNTPFEPLPDQDFSNPWAD